MGYARLDAGLKESLKRDQPRPVRAYNKGLTVTHAHLISLFTRRQWERYEHLYLRWGKGPGGIQLLFKRIQERGITSGPIYELAKLRTQDRSVHQKGLAEYPSSLYSPSNKPDGCYQGHMVACCLSYRANICHQYQHLSSAAWADEIRRTVHSAPAKVF